MALFGFGKAKEDRQDSGQVLAWLEDALKARSPFTLGLEKGREVPALLHGVNEDARCFRLQPKDDPRLDKGAKVAFTFQHEGLRVGGTARVLETRPGTLTLSLPAALELQERRAGPRARLAAKEMATLTALQELAAGIGVSGGLENLSPGGARVRVERAMAIGSEKMLVLGSNLVKPGQAFQVIKLGKVPRCAPAMETSGRAVYLAHDGGALVLGFAFGALAAPVETALRGLVAQRCPVPPAVLPFKARRRPEPAEGPPEAPPEPASGTLQASAPGAAARDPGSGTAAQAERRQAPRLSLGPGYRARFMAGDRLVPEAELTDISSGGCCLRLAWEHCRDLRREMALEEFHLVHADLPNGILPAQVRWVLGRAGEAAGRAAPPFGLVGVAFGPLPEATAQALAGFVARYLAATSSSPGSAPP